MRVTKIECISVSNVRALRIDPTTLLFIPRYIGCSSCVKATPIVTTLTLTINSQLLGFFLFSTILRLRLAL